MHPTFGLLIQYQLSNKELIHFKTGMSITLSCFHILETILN